MPPVMKRIPLAAPFLLLLAYGFSTRQTATHVFDEIAPGVYFASGNGPVTTGSNSMVVVNENDVLLVDSHISPEAARALIASIKSLTDKPIRTVVNSHYHYDHANGNQVFGNDDATRNAVGSRFHGDDEGACLIDHAGDGA